MSILNKIFKPYTAEEIQSALSLCVISYAEQIRQELEQRTIPKEIMKEYRMLRNNGFTNSANLKRSKELIEAIEDYNNRRENNIEAVKFMQVLNNTFGNEATLISHSDFINLLNKYNLVCGSFSDYTGNIPLDKLEEVNRINKILGSLNNDLTYRDWDLGTNYYERNNTKLDHIYAISKIDSIDMDRRISKSDYKNIHRFPFIVNTNKFLEIDHIVETKNLYTWMFIVAPSQEMNLHIKKLKHYDFRRAEDPFICSYSDLGIIIYTKWGDEANDAIFERYNELKQLVNEKVRKA